MATTMMMDPASSSDDDSFSSSSSGEEGPIHNGLNGSEPLGGDDEEYGARNISNFDDLPTDDSEDDSDGSDSESGGSFVASRRDAGIGHDGENEEEIYPEDVPLSERVASRAQAGRRYYAGEDNSMNRQDGTIGFDDGGKKRRAERKSRAIESASARLREARREKAAKSDERSSGDDGYDNGDNDDDSKEGTKKKKSKHRPTEISSKRRDYFARGRPDLNSAGIGVSIGANRYRARDPRTVSLSGHLDADVFDKRYGFLDEVQDKEIERLRRRVDAWKKSGKKGQRERRKLGMNAGGGGSPEEDGEELTRLLQERAERKKARVARGAKRAVKRKMKEDVASGKRGAYYPKRSEWKRMEAEARYDEIRKKGGDEAVDKAIAKRRKKNVSKAAKQMPSHKVS